MSAHDQKIEAARAALADVREGMTLGLGTGSTAAEFVRLLAQSPFVKSLRCTTTSKATEDLATSLGIATFELADVAPLDLAIDGADEVDADLRLIKGRGGALLREKIVEQQAKRFTVIVDDSKIVERLGAGVLPVEVTPFACNVLMRRFDEMSLQPVLRLRDGKTFTTDEQHVIVDIRIPAHADIADVVARLREHAGVVETGFFPTEATDVIIAGESGIRRRSRA
jgi:ribose 5-phosphate isomerase A